MSQIVLVLLFLIAVAALVFSTIQLRSATRDLRRGAGLTSSPPGPPVPGPHVAVQRIIIPMSSESIVEPGSAIRVVGSPGNGLPFYPERIILGDASDWIVNDIAIDGKSQLAQSGDIPGDMFAAEAIDAFVRLDVVPPNGRLEIAATYVGYGSGGARFQCSVLGECAVRQAPSA